MHAEDESSNQHAHEGKHMSINYIFCDINMGPKSKTDSELLVFPLVKFRKVWQNGNKHFALAGACFSGKSTDQFFFFLQQ